MNFSVIIGLTIPFLGTVLGAALVFLLQREMKPVIEKSLLGFASGVMIAASIWSLLIPCIEIAQENGMASWLPASIGFLCGIFFLLFLDIIIPHLHFNSEIPEGRPVKLQKSFMLLLAVTLHNIPEGMAVGVVFASLLGENSFITIAAALSLSVGIALQNFPEGAVISMPLVTNGMKKSKAFGFGVLSGIVEPIAALITIFITELISPLLPYVLSFAAGAMMYVVIEELIPESQEKPHSNWVTIFTALGFVLMMILDTTLG